MTTAIEYALMAGRAYLTNRGQINQFPIPDGWTEFFHVPDPSILSFPTTNGFEAVTFKSVASPKDLVISFAGTDPSDITGDIAADLALAGGTLSAQLRQAADYYLQIKNDSANAGKTISFTGLSLGGGLVSLMAVMFGESAYTFDQAPFLNSAKTFATTDFLTGNTIPRSVAQDLRGYLAGKVPDDQLVKLDSYITAADPGNPNPNATDTLFARGAQVTNINTQGEFLSSWFLVPSSNRIGSQSIISNSNGGVSGLDLHSQALLTAFLQSNQTAAPNKGLNDVTFKLPDLLKMIFDSNLFAYTTAKTNTTDPNFLEYIVQHEAGIQKLYHPDIELSKRYHNQFEVFKLLYKQLEPLFDQAHK